MAKPKILVPLDAVRVSLPDHLPEYTQFLEDFDVHFEKVHDAEELKKVLQDPKYADFEGLWATEILFRIGGLGTEYLEFLPKNLKIISFAWVGANLFDVEGLRERNVILANGGDISSKDVADVALSLTLSTFRFLPYFERSFREADGDVFAARTAIGSTELNEKGEPIPPTKFPNWSKDLTIGGKFINSPNGKVAGLVGFGSIGKEIAKRLDVIGLKVKYTKRKPLTEQELSQLSFKPEFIESFDELISQVDVLVLAVPHTPETVHLINSESIKHAKKGIRIVNIGRGTVLDEDVLFKALEDGTVTAAGLDVFQNEPHIDKRFLSRPEITILPHIGSFTLDTFKGSAIRVFENFKDVLIDGNEGLSVVN